jgi:hypothetical protein
MVREIKAVQTRIEAETRISYSLATIVRGLIALGLSALRDRPSFVAELANARVPRGRKPAPAEESATGG